MTLEREPLLAGGEVPDFDQVVVAARDQGLTVPADGQGIDTVGMPAQHALLARR